MGLGDFLLNGIFPKQCFGCRKLGTYMCNVCTKLFKPILIDVCPYCLKSSYGGLTHPGCRRLRGIDGLKSLFYYTGHMRKVIKQIKYKLVREGVDDLFSAISLHSHMHFLQYKQLIGDIILIPVPLHKNRHNKRGFNQSQLLANALARKLDSSVVADVVFRIKDTTAQAMQKNKIQRYTNMLGAFSINRLNKDKLDKGEIIIVDDIWTTGATIKEMARTIKKYTNRKVFAYTLAR